MRESTGKHEGVGGYLTLAHGLRLLLVHLEPDGLAAGPPSAKGRHNFGLWRIASLRLSRGTGRVALSFENWRR
eukprot:151694-Amorphochlora_amoeboformis.AAC.2